MENPLVSVIVPVYNVETYIYDCIESVLLQTYVNLELLLVDDGSKDKSGQICDQFSKRDCRVKVLHKKNGGASSARNYGIDRANGEYLIFLDADDYWIENDFLRQFVNRIVSNGLDVLRGEYHRVKLDSRNYYDLRDKQVTNNVTTFDSYQMLDVIGDEFFSILFLFKRSVLKDIRYDDKMIFQEDMDFLVRIFSMNLKCGYFPIPFYAYRQHENNASFQSRKEIVINGFSICERFHNYAQVNKDSKFAEFLLYKIVKAYLSSLEMLSYSPYCEQYNEIDDVVHINELRKNVLTWSKHTNKKMFFPYLYVSPQMGLQLFKIKRFVGNNLRKIGLRK